MLMNLPYFYEPSVSKQQHNLSEETSKHCVQVLRMKANDTLNLTDGKGNLYKAVIINPDKKNCLVSIEEIKTTNSDAHNKNLSVAISILKNPARLEWFIEKAAEIGVRAIFPLICDHTEKENFRHERMKSILIAAMLQSEQTFLTELHQPEKFHDFIDKSFDGLKLIAHCSEGEKIILTNFKTNQSILILVGPEGDFSSSEVEASLKRNFVAVSLGNTRLRTETAGVVAAALLCNSHQ